MSSNISGSEESIVIDHNQLFVSQAERKRLMFEETLQLMDAEGQPIDEVTIAVENNDMLEDGFVVYQYSQKESCSLRVQSHVHCSLETASEMRRIKKFGRTNLLKITDADDKYDLFKLSLEGNNGRREMFDINKSSTHRVFLEGSNIVLLRKVALNRLYGRFSGRTINNEGELCPCEYEVEEVDQTEVRVRRKVTDNQGKDEILTTLLSEEGKIMEHRWSRSELYLVTTTPKKIGVAEAVSQEEEILSEPEVKADQTAYFEKKEALILLMKLYLQDHSDVQDMIADFLKNLLFEKPNDVIDFADQFFTEFLAIRRDTEETDIQSSSDDLDINRKNNRTE